MGVWNLPLAAGICSRSVWGSCSAVQMSLFLFQSAGIQMFSLKKYVCFFLTSDQTEIWLWIWAGGGGGAGTLIFIKTQKINLNLLQVFSFKHFEIINQKKGKETKIPFRSVFRATRSMTSLHRSKPAKIKAPPRCLFTWAGQTHLKASSTDARQDEPDQWVINVEPQSWPR